MYIYLFIFFLIYFFFSLLFLSRPPPDDVSAHLWVGAGLEWAVAAGNSQTQADSYRRFKFNDREDADGPRSLGRLLVLPTSAFHSR